MQESNTKLNEEVDIRKLWSIYISNKSREVKEELINYYLESTKIIAASIYSMRFNNQIDFSDYYHYGILGLIDAIDRYDISREIQFMSFAKFRIKGSILNGISKMSDVLEKVNTEHKTSRYEERLLLLRSQKDIGDIDPFDEMVDLSISLALGSFLDNDCKNSDEFCYYCEEDLELKETLDHFVKCLNEDERIIISYHYFHEVAFKTISEIIGISRSRVAQLHKQGLMKLRELLEQSVDLDA